MTAHQLPILPHPSPPFPSRPPTLTHASSSPPLPPITPISPIPLVATHFVSIILFSLHSLCLVIPLTTLILIAALHAPRPPSSPHSSPPPLWSPPEWSFHPPKSHRITSWYNFARSLVVTFSGATTKATVFLCRGFAAPWGALTPRRAVIGCASHDVTGSQVGNPASATGSAWIILIWIFPCQA